MKKHLLLIYLTAVLLPPLAPLRAADTTPAKPNFVIILVDDMGYGDIAPFGSKKNRTPNLDRMASEGMKLTSFYAAPLCTASRSQIMTGCYAKRVSMPAVLYPAQPIGLSHKEKTIAELLKPQGYATMCIGKWHLGDQPEFLPTRRGFDHYVGLPYSNDMGGMKKGKGKRSPPLPLLKDEKVVEAPAVQNKLEALYTDEAVKFITANKDRPFFLYLPHTAVHKPYNPGLQFKGKSANGEYGDWVEEVDWSVGCILNTLRQLKLDKNTLVLFTSDNGGVKGGVASNGPLRGFKSETWEGGMREPTLVCWPGTIPAGSSSDAVMSEIDVLPTLVALAGGKVPADRKIDGLDIWPVLSGKSKQSPHEVLYYFKKGVGRIEGVRSGPWKLLNAELYNMDSDIGETKNVADKNPEVVKKLMALIDKMDKDLENGGIRPHDRVNNPKPLSMDGREYD
jgi:arylsulfatase A-like enzyme